MSIDQPSRRSTDSELHARIDTVEIHLIQCQTDVLKRITTISDDLAGHKEDVSKLELKLTTVAENLQSIYDLMLEGKEVLKAYKTAKGFFDSIYFLANASKALIPIIFLISMVTGGVVYITMTFL
jgi:uncharacterized coiled-coil protein SlyX